MREGAVSATRPGSVSASGRVLDSARHLNARPERDPREHLFGKRRFGWRPKRRSNQEVTAGAARERETGARHPRRRMFRGRGRAATAARILKDVFIFSPGLGPAFFSSPLSGKSAASGLDPR